MIQACIFDLDGVIVDTARYHYLAWSRLAQELGITFTLSDNERLKGVSRMESLNILLSIGNKTFNAEQKEELATRKNHWFVEYIEHMNPSEIFPGVLDLLREIKENGLRLGLASSSKNAPQVIRALNISGLFDAIVDGSMVKNAKPDPEIFLLTANNLGVPAGSSVVFEDAAAGVEAAHAAGMKCVGVGSKEQLYEADALVTRTADFKLAVLKQW